MAEGFDVDALKRTKHALSAARRSGTGVTLSAGLEWDNEEAIDTDAAVANIRHALEILAAAPAFVSRPIDAMLVFDPASVGADFADDLQRRLHPTPPDIALRLIPIEGATYYTMKSASARLGTGDILLLMDCDCRYEPDWLATIIDDLLQSDALVASGRTLIEGHNFVGRAMSLFWIFPHHRDIARERNRRILNANCAALVRRLLVDLPFPEVPGGRIQCTLWREQLERLGVKIQKSSAVAHHSALDTVSAVIARARLYGSDADRHTFHRRSTARWRRSVSAIGRFAKALTRATKRNLTIGRACGLQLWQVPASIGLAACFHCVVLVTQLKSALFDLGGETRLPSGTRGQAGPLGAASHNAV